MPFTIVTQGTFTQGATAVNQRIPLPSGADYFRTQNITQLATQQATGVGVIFEWYGNGITAADAAIEWKKTNSTDALNLTSVTSGGFTYFTSFPAPEAAKTGTAITAATPAVATINSHGYQNGDRVVLYNTTAMLQIAGMSFAVGNVTTNTFELDGLAAAGFAAAATAVTARRLSPFDPVEPEFLFVTAISQASSAVVTTSINHSYVVGQKVRFQVPSTFGMVEISGLTGNITAVGSTNSPGTGLNNQFTVDINSTNFTAFAFPASTASPTAALFATVSPAGQNTTFNTTTLVQTGYNFSYAPFHSGLFIPQMLLKAGAQSPAGQASDQIVWQAYKMEV